MKSKTENELDDNFDAFQDEEVFEEDFAGEIGGLSAQEQMALQKKAVKKYKDLDKIQIVDNFRAFILKEFPQIINGFDRSIYSQAKHTYWREENLFEFWLIPIKTYEKIKKAEDEVAERLKVDAQEHAEKMFPTWYENYKSWLLKNELKKSTKANVKDYFKQIKVKPTEAMVERVKERHSN